MGPYCRVWKSTSPKRTLGLFEMQLRMKQILCSDEPANRPYRLEGALPGFRTYAQSGIVLQVNSSPSINISLEVGQVSEQVEFKRMRPWWKPGVLVSAQL